MFDSASSGRAPISTAGTPQNKCINAQSQPQQAASQAAAGPVSPGLIDEIGRAMGRFRRLLLKDKTERLGMPLAVYQESERFLNQLENAGQLLKPGLAAPGGEARLKGNAPSTSYCAP